MRVRLVVAGALALLATWACASAPRGGADCHSLPPAHARSLTEVVDSVGLHGALDALWHPGMDRTLARVVYDSLGVLERAVVVSPGPAKEQDALAKVVLGVAAAEGGPGPVFMVLGGPEGPAPRRVTRFEACGPQVLNRAWLSERLSESVKELGLRETCRVWLEVWVDRNGQAGDVRIAESSGHAEADLVAGRLARGMTFRPAVMAGVEVAVWARFPVTFEVQR